MKLLFIMLFSFGLVQDMSFPEKILNDFDRNSRFVCINIKSLEYNGLVIIENDDLFFFLNQTQHFDKTKYKSFVKMKLEKKIFIDIGNVDLKKWNFFKLNSSQKVDKNAKKGIAKFIKIYFNNNVLKDGVTDNERIAIIRILFNNKISSYIDDETGYLIIG